MGGGGELAPACRYRVAVDQPGTRFALPEVMLGILPAWGGVMRLPRLVGPTAALDMLLTAASTSPMRLARRPPPPRPASRHSGAPGGPPRLPPPAPRTRPPPSPRAPKEP